MCCPLPQVTFNVNDENMLLTYCIYSTRLIGQGHLMNRSVGSPSSQLLYTDKNSKSKNFHELNWHLECKRVDLCWVTESVPSFVISFIGFVLYSKLSVRYTRGRIVTVAYIPVNRNFRVPGCEGHDVRILKIVGVTSLCPGSYCPSPLHY